MCIISGSARLCSGGELRLQDARVRRAGHLHCSKPLVHGARVPFPLSRTETIRTPAVDHARQPPSIPHLDPSPSRYGDPRCSPSASPHWRSCIRVSPWRLFRSLTCVRCRPIIPASSLQVINISASATASTHGTYCLKVITCNPRLDSVHPTTKVAADYTKEKGSISERF